MLTSHVDQCRQHEDWYTVTDAWVLHLVHYVAIYLYTVSQICANFVKLQFRQAWTNFSQQHQRVRMGTWSMSCAAVSRASCALWLSGFCIVARSACTSLGITSSATTLHWVISCCCEAWLRLERPAPPAALISCVAADAACFDAC